MAQKKHPPASAAELLERQRQALQGWQNKSFIQLYTELRDALGKTNEDIWQALPAGAYSSAQSFRNAVLQDDRRSYDLVHHLIQSNALQLPSPNPSDPEDIGQALRCALFTAAGFIEITEQNIRQWNQEVLAAHRDKYDNDIVFPRPTFGDLMRKLLAFQMQGRHFSINTLLNQAQARQPFQPIAINRIEKILQDNADPSPEEVMILMTMTGLNAEQDAEAIGYITSRLPPLIDPDAPTRIPHKQHREASLFSQELTVMLAELKSHGIAHQRIIDTSRDPTKIPCGSGYMLLNQSMLWHWKSGASKPTLPALRMLGKVLELYESAGKLAPRPDGQGRVKALLNLLDPGYKELYADSDMIIAGITPQTHIISLLKHLADAPDINKNAEELYDHSHAPCFNGHITSASQIVGWFYDSRSATFEATEQLLTVMADIRGREFTPAQIEKVKECWEREPQLREEARAARANGAAPKKEKAAVEMPGHRITCITFERQAQDSRTFGPDYLHGTR